MTRITAVVAIIALLQTGVFHAQAPVHTPDGWDAALTARMGTRVRVTLQDGTIVSGRLAESRADALVLKNINVERGRLVSRTAPQGDLYTVDRADIAKVDGIAKRMSGKKRVLMGVAVVGAFIGAIVVALFVWCASENSRCGA